MSRSWASHTLLSGSRRPSSRNRVRAVQNAWNFVTRSPLSETPRVVYAPKPAGSFWAGDHSHILTPMLDGANKQFAEGKRNVLALVPLVDFPVLHGRRPFVKAFFGEMKIVLTIDKKTGKAVDEPRAEFITGGKFLKLWPEPRFTRTGAVLVVREHLLERNPFEEDFEAWTELRWFVL